MKLNVVTTCAFQVEILAQQSSYEALKAQGTSLISDSSRDPQEEQDKQLLEQDKQLLDKIGQLYWVPGNTVWTC